ncbi:DUF2459 domain-containing protein [Pseudooctadecabacter sp.]|uniref:DUF2459 domain-containing protein n=1 Tax=Pseudooctadecabacter sp. TaxID=1966338 RepID=UPI0025F4D27C|nr:DUF2459 domain-containing protein [Pseudooctadecabacter sp.]
MIAAFVAALWSSDGGVSDGSEGWIVLVQGPIHYDILLPLDEDTEAVFKDIAEAGVPLDHPNAAWLSVGWGSAAFYTTAGSYADIRPGAVWRAATGDAGVLRFEVYGPLPDHPALRRVPVTFAQLSALRSVIRAQAGDAPVRLALDGFSQTDAFFAAAGRFHIFRTCNVWVGAMLREAGVPFGWWTPTPYAVTASLRWNGLIP